MKADLESMSRASQDAMRAIAAELARRDEAIRRLASELKNHRPADDVRALLLELGVFP